MCSALAIDRKLATLMYCSSAPIDRERNDRRVGLERETHEAEPEVGELVAMLERLGEALVPSGKTRIGSPRVEQALSRSPARRPPGRIWRRTWRRRAASATTFRPWRAPRAAGCASRKTEIAMMTPSSGIWPEWLATMSTRPAGRVLDPCDDRAEIRARQRGRRGDDIARVVGVPAERVHAVRGELARTPG